MQNAVASMHLPAHTTTASLSSTRPRTHRRANITHAAKHQSKGVTQAARQTTGRRQDSSAQPSHDEEDDGFMLLDGDNDAALDPGLQQWGSYDRNAGGGVALAAQPTPQLVKAVDKNRLKPALRAELARRLRREAPDYTAVPGQMHVLRVFRFALDDLRLFRAIYEADMEGRVVVVDEPSKAHVVLAVQHSRTGRHVPMANARNLAANLGIPFIPLERVSAVRLMAALAPLMRLPMPPHLLLPKAPARPIIWEQPEAAAEAAAVLQQLQLQHQPYQPTMQGASRIDQQQQQLQNTQAAAMGHPAAAGMPGQQSRGLAQVQERLPPGLQPVQDQSASAPQAVTIGSLLGIKGGQQQPQHQQHQHQQQQHRAGQRTALGDFGPGQPAQAGGRVGQSATHSTSTIMAQPDGSRGSQGHARPNGAAWLGLEEAVGDVGDDRAKLMPPNPTARLGGRHRIARPIKHGRRLAVKRELRLAAQEHAPW